MRTFQQITSARAGEGYLVHVAFADGTDGVFDFAPYLHYPCYAPLRDREIFAQVTAAHGTLSWPGGIDISPEAVWAEAARGANS